MVFIYLFCVLGFDKEMGRCQAARTSKGCYAPSGIEKTTKYPFQY